MRDALRAGVLNTPGATFEKPINTPPGEAPDLQVAVYQGEHSSSEMEKRLAFMMWDNQRFYGLETGVSPDFL